jgi:hypothetical protein
MEDVAVYGYITPLKVKIILALALSDSVVRDTEITMVRSGLHRFGARVLTVQLDIQGLAYGVLFIHFEPISQTGDRFRSAW